MSVGMRALAYLNRAGDKPVLQDVAHMGLHDGRLEPEILLGAEKVISGKVVEVDFAASRILPDAGHESEKYS